MDCLVTFTIHSTLERSSVYLDVETAKDNLVKKLFSFHHERYSLEAGVLDQKPPQERFNEC